MSTIHRNSDVIVVDSAYAGLVENPHSTNLSIDLLNA
jgi:hypothetical protein